MDNLSHDWATSVDADHLADIRRDPARYAPGGLGHLVLEIMAYAADECTRCTVTLHGDGSVSVADDGRGTAIRHDERGQPVRKPVMATKDLRFFEQPSPPSLPDGHPRRGASVVAALSEWLVHTNRRQEGAWSQRYEYGVPVTDLRPVPVDDTTGTTVRFRPGPAVTPPELPDLATLARLGWPNLSVEVRDERAVRRFDHKRTDSSADAVHRDLRGEAPDRARDLLVGAAGRPGVDLDRHGRHRDLAAGDGRGGDDHRDK